MSSIPRILIVSDDKENLTLWVSWLKGLEEDVELLAPKEKRDLQAILESCDSPDSQFAVIVLDYNLEEWGHRDEFPRDGKEVLERLRPNPKVNKLPYVILLTVYDDDRTRYIEKTYGAMYKDSKTITGRLLIDAVERFLSRL